MTEHKHKKAIRLGGALVCLLFFMITGCAPSIRYTRNCHKNNTDAHVYNYQQKPLQTQSEIKLSRSVSADNLHSAVASYIGIPYRRGGESRAGFDCSGFVCAVYKEVYNLLLPRSSVEMSKYGKKVSLAKAISGDLVFFRNYRVGKINHVGIYLGDGRFVHASVKHGVRYSFLKESYYAKRFALVRRVFE